MNAAQKLLDFSVFVGWLFTRPTPPLPSRRPEREICVKTKSVLSSLNDALCIYQASYFVSHQRERAKWHSIHAGYLRWLSVDDNNGAIRAKVRGRFEWRGPLQTLNQIFGNKLTCRCWLKLQLYFFFLPPSFFPFGAIQFVRRRDGDGEDGAFHMQMRN